MDAKDKALELLQAYYDYEFDGELQPDYSSGSDEVYGLMYTTADDSEGVEHEIQASVDLSDSSILYYVDNELVEKIRFNSLEDLVDRELADFAETPDYVFDYYYEELLKYID